MENDQRLIAFKRLLDVMDALREGCPWDREQTFESLRNNTIEETYELIDALTAGNMDGIKEELGDLLLHIVFYSKIGSEQGAFDIADVANRICDKLIYRHPHVFGDAQAADSGAVVKRWEDMKSRERNGKAGVLSGVPASLPSVVKALRIQEKAAATGFDWEKKEDIWDKVREEIGELETEIASGDAPRSSEEFGDVMFALVNVARAYGIDPEAALEGCNKRFIARFNYMEQQTVDSGRKLKELSLGQMEHLWQEAKSKGM